ncbi:MAG: hypothetical protein ACTSRP_10335, partial [Candidatus Helarchaeota archaeon]
MTKLKLNFYKIMIILLVSTMILPVEIYNIPNTLLGYSRSPEHYNNDDNTETMISSNLETYNHTGKYIEQVSLNVDRYGNLSINGIINWSSLDFGLTLTAPEYNGKYIVFFIAMREKRTPDIFDYYNISKVDYYLGITTMSVIDPELVLKHSKFIVNDVKVAFGIQNLDYLGKFPFMHRGRFPYETTNFYADMLLYIFGGNYSGMVNFNYFTELFRNTMPKGLGDVFTDTVINSAEYASLGWLIYNVVSEEIQKELIIQLEYPHYYNFSAPNNFTLDILNLFNVQKINSTSLGIAHEIYSTMEIYLANCKFLNYSYMDSEFVEFKPPSKLIYTLLDYEPSWRGLKELVNLTVNFSNPLNKLELLKPKDEVIDNSSIRALFQNPEDVDHLYLHIWKKSDYIINHNSKLYQNYLPPDVSYELTNALDFSNLDNKSLNITDFDACIDSKNNIHVVYSKETSPGSDREVFYANFSNNKWTTVQITDDDLQQQNVKITLDDLNTVHICYEQISLDTEIMYVNNSGGNFNTPISVSQNPGNNDYNPIITSTGTNVYVIWTNQTSIYYRIYYIGGVIGPIHNITNSNSQCTAINAAINTSNVIHLLVFNYTTNISGYISHTVSILRTSKFKAIYNYSKDISGVKYCDIKVDSNNDVHIIYYGENNDLQYFNISSGGQWNSKINLTDNGNSTKDFACSLAFDSKDNVIISYLREGSPIESHLYNLSSMTDKRIYIYNGKSPNNSIILIDSKNKGILITSVLVIRPKLHKGVVFQFINDTWFTSLKNEFLYNLDNGDYVFELELITNNQSQSVLTDITINNTIELNAEILEPVQGYKSSHSFETINISVNITSGPVNISIVYLFMYCWQQNSYLTGFRRFVFNWSTFNNSEQRIPVIYRFQWSTNALFKTGNYTIVIYIIDKNNVTLELNREIYIIANGVGIQDPQDGDVITGTKKLILSTYLGSGCSVFGTTGLIMGQFFVSVLRSNNLDPIVIESYQEVYITGIFLLGSIEGDLVSSDLEDGEYILLPSLIITDGVNQLYIDFWENITIINITNPTPLVVNPGSNWSNIFDIFVLNFTLAGSINTGPDSTPHMSYMIHSTSKYIPILHQYSLSMLYMGAPWASGITTAEHKGLLYWNKTKSIWEINRTANFYGQNDSGWATYNVQDDDYILTVIRYTNKTYWGGLGGYGNFEFITPDTLLTTMNPEKLTCTIYSPQLNDTIENSLIINATFSEPYGHLIDVNSVKAEIYIHNGSQNNHQFITSITLAYNPLTDCYDGIASIGNISSQYLQVIVSGTIGEKNFEQVGIMNYTFIRSKYSPDGIAPIVPANINATAQTDRTILLEWVNSTSTDVETFIIFRNSTEFNPYILKILPSSKLNYTDFQVSEGVLYRYWIIAIDDNGMVSNYISTTEIPDKTPPSINLITPENMKFYNKILLINASIIEDYHLIDKAYCILSNSTWTSKMIYLKNNIGNYYYNDTINTSNYNDGLYNLTVYSNDTIGNLNSQSISIYFDNSVPIVENIYSPIENHAYHPNLTITVLVTDLAGVNTTWAYITNNTYNATVILSRVGSTDIWTGVWKNISGQLYSDGKYNISILANDTLSNGYIRTPNRSFYIDSNIPIIEEPINSPENGFYYKEYVLINASISDPNGIDKAWCEIKNGSGWIDNITLNTQGGDIYANNWTTAGIVADGEYQLIVFANDTTGSVAESSTYIIYVDNTLPTSVMVSRVTDNWTNPHDSQNNDTEFRDLLIIYASYYEENINSVEFYNGTNLLGINKTATTNEAIWKWKVTVQRNNVQLKVKVIDK